LPAGVAFWASRPLNAAEMIISIKENRIIVRAFFT